ncbi:hypothetical protein JTE90_005593 [Oedothorax gibbosus]|uniref:Glycoprotein-N-acetylgalactosamine 3-beta-galactosyltransferase 1 n=1 Tax=Oedothorax gibbosus TaxID=931172 RepID=A0AAV6VB46_9ARAC|nr:hypothetical protein JTE90_005593 [Oedothorax gibbosus]
MSPTGDSSIFSFTNFNILGIHISLQQKMWTIYAKSMTHRSLSFPFYLILWIGIIFGFGFAYIWMSATASKRTNGFSNAVGAKVHYTVDRSVAEDYYNKVRILCWVVTNPKNHKTKARVIKQTWGSRCNTLLFISTEKTNKLPTIALNANDMWKTTIDVLSYIHDNYIDSADWFLKADDENFIVLENVRLLLKPYNPDKPLYFGRKYKKHVEQGYMSSGAGYVLSREAVKLFVEVALRDPKKCNQGIALDDVELGSCLSNVGVLAGDSHDILGKQRFFPFQPEVHMTEEYLVQLPWFLDYINTNASNALETDCCSQTTISFSYVPPDIIDSVCRWGGSWRGWHSRRCRLVESIDELEDEVVLVAVDGHQGAGEVAG